MAGTRKWSQNVVRAAPTQRAGSVRVRDPCSSRPGVEFLAIRMTEAFTPPFARRSWFGTAVTVDS